MEVIFLTQMVSKPTRGSPPLCTADVLFMSRGGLVGDVLIRGHLWQSPHRITLFLFLGEVRKLVNKTSSLDFVRTDFSLFRTLFRESLGKRPLKTKEGWAYIKTKILKAQKQAIPMC